MSDWQPIETAPKDGTEIDAWVVEAGGTADGRRFTEVKWIAGCWKWYYERDGDFMKLDGEPWLATHWMPIPAPPRVIQQLEREK